MKYSKKEILLWILLYIIVSLLIYLIHQINDISEKVTFLYNEVERAECLHDNK